MAGFDDPAFYGARWASVYDNSHGGLDPDSAVDCLAELAGGGRVLELAIGTGRIALPLARRGVIVEGVDASEAMLEQLPAKPGGDSIRVTIGDMAQVGVGGPFGLVYLVANAVRFAESGPRGRVLRERGQGARPGRDVRHRMLRP
jgi:SAM-dependent methyltransferase